MSVGYLLQNIEILKLVVSSLGSLLTSVMGLVVGYWIARSIKALEHRQWSNQKLAERRMGIFDETAKPLNEVYCYFHRVGNWKTLTPDDITNIKRNLDEKIYVNSALFSSEFHQRYKRFMDSCFKTNTGHLIDAKLRTFCDKYTKLPNWKNEWEERFCENPDPKRNDNYRDLMDRFAKELGV